MSPTKTGLRDLKRSNKKYIYWLIGIISLFLIFYFALLPYREELATGFIENGDSFLADRKYLEAIVEYKKADYLDSKGSAKEKINLAGQAQLNVKELEMFLREEDKIETLELLNSASKVPSYQSDGLKKVKSLIEDNEPQMAEITAEILIEMDKENKEAWTYLGLARLQTARIVQMTGENREKKLNSAKEAFAQAHNLDSNYQLAKEYLKEIEQMLL